VRFGDHVSIAQAGGMASQIAAYGDVTAGEEPREYLIEVFRLSKLPSLKEQLTKWETYGFLRWREINV
jgi:hypothetical protein